MASGETRDRRSDRAHREDAPGESEAGATEPTTHTSTLDNVNRKETKR